MKLGEVVSLRAPVGQLWVEILSLDGKLLTRVPHETKALLVSRSSSPLTHFSKVLLPTGQLGYVFTPSLMRLP